MSVVNPQISQPIFKPSQSWICQGNVFEISIFYFLFSLVLKSSINISYFSLSTLFLNLTLKKKINDALTRILFNVLDFLDHIRLTRLDSPQSQLAKDIVNHYYLQPLV